MRHASFVVLLASLVACGDEAHTIPVTVQWMDWPADVFAGEAFRTRLVVSGVCALNPRFYAGSSADPSAVTFAPYFIGGNADIVCIGSRAIDLLVSAIDTAGMAPGLRADYPRTYEMRATASVYVQSAGLDAAPSRTFGDVTVRPWSPVADQLPLPRRNAAGYATLEKDGLGCARIRPLGLYAPGAALVLENPVDTAGLSGHFVRGYIDLVNAPVCGANRVFHLVSRN